jgi:16S rRNA (cytidine1402-2'-O)-methyltransferase
VLYVIGTPIGNLEDASYRAVRLLGEVDALACEDTRQTRKLLDRYGIAVPRVLLSYHEHNEAPAGERILGLLAEGLKVALCTDAGMPGISDPGYRLVAACRDRGLAVEVIPGPDAVSSAVVTSGLPTSSFVFKGFPPRKSGARRRFLEAEGAAAHTLVLFESPHRIGALLRDARDVLGNRLAAVCIELTKMFEQVDRGPLAELAERYAERTIKGEITVVIAGSNPKFLAGQDARDEDSDAGADAGDDANGGRV